MRGRSGKGAGKEEGGSNRFWERKVGKCVKCAYRRRNSPPAASTPLRAGSASSMKTKCVPPLPSAGSLARVFGGLKGGKKGGFTSDSSNTPLGRRISTKYLLYIVESRKLEHNCPHTLKVKYRGSQH